MQQANIVNFSVFISVALLYMDTMQPEPRVQVFETTTAALKPLLEACGRPLFLKAVFETWASMTNSLVVLERNHFPDLPPETRNITCTPKLPSTSECHFGSEIPWTPWKIWPSRAGPKPVHRLVYRAVRYRPSCWHAQHVTGHNATPAIVSGFGRTRSCRSSCWRSASCAGCSRASSHCGPTSGPKSAVYGPTPWRILTWPASEPNFPGSSVLVELVHDAFWIFFPKCCGRADVCATSMIAGERSMATRGLHWCGVAFWILQQWCDHAFPIAVEQKEWSAISTFSEFSCFLVFHVFGFHFEVSCILEVLTAWRPCV